MHRPDRILHPDAQRIKDMGGPTKVAERLKLGSGGVQRVGNWMRRGIPASVKLAHPSLFLKPLRSANDEAKAA